MHPQDLHTLSSRLAHRLRIGNVIHLHAHALLDQPCEDLRMRRAADEPLGEIDERREPRLEHLLRLWRRGARHGRYSRLGTTAVRVAYDNCREWSDWILRRGLGETTHCARYSGYARWRMTARRARYRRQGGSGCRWRRVKLSCI